MPDCEQNRQFGAIDQRIESDSSGVPISANPFDGDKLLVSKDELVPGVVLIHVEIDLAERLKRFLLCVGKASSVSRGFCVFWGTVLVCEKLCIGVEIRRFGFLENSILSALPIYISLEWCPSIFFSPVASFKLTPTQIPSWNRQYRDSCIVCP